MTWKAIGQSVIGTSHISSGKECEDAIQYAILPGNDNKEVLVCCAGDGAGSALNAKWAATYTTNKVLDFVTKLTALGNALTEGSIYAMLEDIYDGLEQEAQQKEEELNEFSCTLLGCIIGMGRSAFFQVGDGAIVRNDGSGFYTTVWWPENGEYQNTTSFLVDDRSFANVNITILEEEVNEVALFTDGLQMLALNTETQTVHQPLFADLFKFLRMADDGDKINVLNRKLAEYLGSNTINDRTDDDKTLFLATRITT